LRSVEVRAIAGTVELSGPNTLNEVCTGTESHTDQPCADTTRAFENARTTLLSTKAGSITLRPLRVALSRIDCPEEPGDVVAAPLGPPPGPLRISLAHLANRRVVTITLTASVSRRKNYASPEQGTISQRSSWKLTFTRLRP
jgi:hypothetical protein